MKKALVPLAEGCEELEAVSIIDTLRRAEWTVVAAGLKPGPVTASRGVRLLPDAVWAEINPLDFDVLILPGGGPGTEALKRDARVLDAVRAYHRAGKIVAAICAAPTVLHEAGVLDGKKATCYPGCEGALTRATFVGGRVVQDGNIITSQGPATGVEFALRILAAAEGEAKAREVARGMVAAGA